MQIPPVITGERRDKRKRFCTALETISMGQQGRDNPMPYETIAINMAPVEGNYSRHLYIVWKFADTDTFVVGLQITKQAKRSPRS